MMREYSVHATIYYSIFPLCSIVSKTHTEMKLLAAVGRSYLYFLFCIIIIFRNYSFLIKFIALRNKKKLKLSLAD